MPFLQADREAPENRSVNRRGWGGEIGKASGGFGTVQGLPGQADRCVARFGGEICRASGQTGQCGHPEQQTEDKALVPGFATFAHSTLPGMRAYPAWQRSLSPGKAVSRDTWLSRATCDHGFRIKLAEAASARPDTAARPTWISGISAQRGSLLSAWTKVPPFSPGMVWSVTMRSGMRRATAARAAWPEVTWRTSWPSFWSISQRSMPSRGWSTTTRMSATARLH